MNHFIASDQEIVHRFIDFLMSRGVTALLLIEERGLALSQYRDIFVEKSFKISFVIRTASVSETSFKLTLTTTQFSGILVSMNTLARALGRWGREGATASAAMRRPVLTDATSSSGRLNLRGNWAPPTSVLKYYSGSNLLINY